MVNKILMIFISAMFATSIVAQNQQQQQEKSLIIGNDLYVGSSVVDVNSSGIDNVFAGGQTISISKKISGSAHLAAQNITIESGVEQSVFAAGQNITIESGVGQNVFVAGQNISVRAKIANDVRAAGDNVKINGNVGGDLLVAARSLEIGATVSGSVVLAVEKLNFTDNARVLGMLTVYTDEENLSIPTSVISIDRVTIKNLDKASKEFVADHQHQHQQSGHLFTYVIKLLVIALAIFGMAILARKRMAFAYDRAKLSVLSNWNYGFLTLSVMLGGIIISAITVIGIPVAIVAILATIILSVLGYYAGSYFIVCQIWEKLRKSLPQGNLNIAVVALFSGVLALLVANIPWFSWWFMLAITFYGLGALLPYRCIKNNGNDTPSKPRIDHET